MAANARKTQQRFLSLCNHCVRRHSGGIRPRRSFLYMPVNNEKFVRKATTLDVDTIVFDLEDAVAPSQKAEARQCAIDALNKFTFLPRSEICIRVNPFSSGLAHDDVTAILSATNLPHTICLPKVQHADEIKWLSAQITKQCGSRADDMEIIGMIETPNAVLSAYQICTADDRLTGIVFGGDDYAASVNAIRTASNHELSFARNMTLINAKLAGLDTIDIVNINFRETEVFLKEAQEGFELGFTGKQCIHPAQAALAQQAFSPPPSKVEWSVKVVAAFDNQSSKGIGAFDLDGEMIDMPTVRIAQNIVTRAKACGLL
eukprot:CAMPEP_0202691570 /NCGR_PEP_ID=MMETSP1385-20130828/6250_1 /ASSEMBLY_ACC=CAM_ASM_000861 /TAXON_ID=933848 /ORGANISM="Elphidium margaritaceum" /LENGTH=316 /DNA_ID=CAMNT_0049346997 /DNA_START=24 /DNA_END=974 /DNA_ORIENTATION=+